MMLDALRLPIIAALAVGTAAQQTLSLRGMPLGASITAGQIGGGVLTNGYRQPLLEKLSAGGWEVHYVGTRTSGNSTENHHEGYPGIRAQALANQTRSKGVVAQLRPNVVLLNVGTNDCTAGVTRAQARAAYVDMIDAVLESDDEGAEGRLLIVSTLLPRRSEEPARQACTVFFNEEVRDLAVSHPRSASIALADMNTGYITVDDLAAGDEVHPSSAGYAKVAEVWYGAIIDNADRIRPPVSK